MQLTKAYQLKMSRGDPHYNRALKTLMRGDRQIGQVIRQVNWASLFMDILIIGLSLVLLFSKNMHSNLAFVIIWMACSLVGITFIFLERYEYVCLTKLSITIRRHGKYTVVPIKAVTKIQVDRGRIGQIFDFGEVFLILPTQVVNLGRVYKISKIRAHWFTNATREEQKYEAVSNEEEGVDSKDSETARGVDDQ